MIAFGTETGKHQCSLGDTERRTYLLVIHKFFIRVNHFHRSEIDAAENDVWFLTRTDICLQGRLTVEFEGEIHHIATFHQAVWRGISPTTGNIHAYWRTRPYNLVAIDRHTWRRLMGKHLLREPLAQEGEGFIGIIAEHGIMDTCQQRSILRKRLRQRDIHLAIFTGGILQIHLIEHAMLPVLGKQGPILLAESTTLGHQAVHIGLVGNIFGGKEKNNPLPTPHSRSPPPTPPRRGRGLSGFR